MTQRDLAATIGVTHPASDASWRLPIRHYPKVKVTSYQKPEGPEFIRPFRLDDPKLIFLCQRSNTDPREPRSNGFKLRR